MPPIDLTARVHANEWLAGLDIHLDVPAFVVAAGAGRTFRDAMRAETHGSLCMAFFGL
jgi:hypothetical protein